MVEVAQDALAWYGPDAQLVQAKMDDHVIKNRSGVVVPVPTHYGPAGAEADADNDGFAVSVSNTRSYVFNRVEEAGFITDYRRETDIKGNLIIELHAAYGMDVDDNDSQPEGGFLGPHRWYVAPSWAAQCLVSRQHLQEAH